MNDCSREITHFAPSYQGPVVGRALCLTAGTPHSAQDTGAKVSFTGAMFKGSIYDEPAMLGGSKKGQRTWFTVGEYSLCYIASGRRFSSKRCPRPTALTASVAVVQGLMRFVASFHAGAT